MRSGAQARVDNLKGNRDKSKMSAIDYKQQLEALVDEIVKLRLARERSDAAFLLRLCDVENDEMNLLRANGLESFERFLKCYKLCDAARYRSFVLGLKKLGKEKSLLVGADATIEAAKIVANGPAATEYVAAIEAWRNQHRGVAPSREAAAKILRQVDPRPEVPDAMRRETRNDALSREVAKLQEENANLRAKLAKTEKERDDAVRRATDLSKQLTKAQRRR